MKEEVTDWFKKFQEKICQQLEKIESGSRFVNDNWSRPGGGGGYTRILSNGNIIEKGGVNFSAVHGEAPEFLKKQMAQPLIETSSFYATGVSIVIHPKNPYVPIIHMNVRYFEMGNTSWFGGGIDLTPHYIIPNDAFFFHYELKKMCKAHHETYYNDFKDQADNYFFLKHRNETRGIGGIFFDQLAEANNISMNDRFNFVKSTGEIFIPVYHELINRNKNRQFGEREIKWQSLRRGRYVEFNLVYDRGTKFGLETNGRAESILMSLPPMANWEYDYKPEIGSDEEFTLANLKKGIDWTKQ